MYNRIRRIVLGLAVITLLSSPIKAQVKIGILPRLSPTELTQMFGPLRDYLSKQIGQSVELVIPTDFATFQQMMKEGKFDYAYANPNIYVDARAALGSEVAPLAIAIETGTGKTFTGCFLVKNGSPIKRVADFKNKKLIFVDESSAGGYLSQVYTMKEAGLSSKDVTVLPFAKKHTNVALAVENGVADVGGIRTKDFAKIKTMVNVPDVQILCESAPIPNWPFFSLPHSQKEITAKIRAALLKLTPKSTEAVTILKSADLDGFVSSSDADFNMMRKLSEATKSF